MSISSSVNSCQIIDSFVKLYSVTNRLMIGLVYFHTVNGISLSESMRQVDGKMVSFKNKQDQLVLRKIQ